MELRLFCTYFLFLAVTGLTCLFAAPAQNAQNTGVPTRSDSLDDGRKHLKKMRSRTKWWALGYQNISQVIPPVSNSIGKATKEEREAPKRKKRKDPLFRLLTKSQRKLVRTRRGILSSIEMGAQKGREECHFQFRHRRWNCSTVPNPRDGNIYGRLINKGSRETAFLYGVMNAAIVWSLARHCAMGAIPCGQCTQYVKRDPNNTAATTMHTMYTRGYPVAGYNQRCSDNIEYAYMIGRKFADVPERGNELRSKLNRHNNEAGRLAVITSRKEKCKCHGISGSCSFKTCWLQMDKFRSIGSTLKEKFDGASLVVRGNVPARPGRDMRDRVIFQVAHPSHKKPTKEDFIYLEDSHDFCTPQKGLGIYGTSGRQCNATSLGVDGCDILCCGRGFRTVTYKITERCNCRFIYCCEVKCENCERQVKEYICN